MQNNQEIWKDIQGYEGKYQVSNLGKVAPCGEKNGGSKLFEKDVLEIRKLFKDGVTRLNISILYKISRSQIERIVNRKRWRNI